MKPLQKAVQQSAAAEGHVWLNVGSGAYPEPRFINLDNHPMLAGAPLYPLLGKVLPRARAEVLGQFYACTQRATYVRYDCRRPLKSIANRVDHILCSHFLEHVYPEEARAIVAGFFAALKPGGTLHLIVPNLAYLVHTYARSNGAEGAADTLQRALLLSRPSRPSWRYRALELLGFEGMQHRWMYDQGSLEQLVTDAGFTALELADVPSREVRKDDPESLHLFAVKAASGVRA